MSGQEARIALAAAGAATVGLWVIAGRLLRPAFGASASLGATVGLVVAASVALGWTWSARRRGLRAEAAGRLVLSLALAAGWLAALPLWGAPLLALVGSGNPLAGAAPAAALLLAVPLALLGSGSEIAVAEIAAESEPRRALGPAAAWAAVGAALGGGVLALLALPWLGESRSLVALALLLFLGLLPGLLRGQGAPVACAVLLGVGASYLVPPGLRGVPTLPSEARWLHRGASRHARIEVVAEGGGVRLLLVDGVIRSRVPMDGGRAGRPEPVAAQLRAVRRYETGGRRALVLGVAAGALARGLDEEGWQVTVVERDAELVRVAREHFDLPAAKLTVEGGRPRSYLRRAATAGERFDLIATEPAPGDADRERLHDRDAYGEMKALLAPRGVLALAAAVFTGPPRDGLARRLAATAAIHFEHVEALDLYPETQDTGDLSRLLLLASEAPPVRAQEPSIEAWPLAVESALEPLGGSRIRSAAWSEPAAAARLETRRRLGAAVLVPE